MARRYRNARELTESETSRIASQFASEEDSVWRWAEANVLLQARATSQPGRYDSSWIQYVRAWQDDFANPHVRRIVIVKGGQMGGTESLLNMMRYAIARDPGPTLWVMPSEGLGRSFSETRLQPSLQDCEATKEQIPTDPDKFKLLEYQLRDAVVNIVGSNSPANLASRPIRYLFGDELDKWAEASDKEAGALELARVRLATFWNSMEVLTSTPTTPTGSIWQQFLLGDQRRFYVPCPLCGHKQVLVWSGKDKGVKWPDDERTKLGGKWNLDAVERLAYYECESCHGPIPQTAKRGMVSKGEWIATNLAAPKELRSYHINALVSPFDKHDWGKLASRFLQAKDTLGGLQDFCNSVLAEPWEERIEAADYSHLAQRKGEYDAAEPWPFERIRVLSADVQKQVIYWTCRAWGLGGVSRMVEYGRCYSFDDLRTVQERLKVQSKNVVIDSGWRTAEVYQACIRWRWYPLKGEDTEYFTVRFPDDSNVRRLWREGETDPALGTSAQGVQKIPLILFCASPVKDTLALFMSGMAPVWELRPDTSEEYLQHLAAERAELDPKKGKRIWRQINANNHWLDCECMNLTWAIVRGLVASEAKKE